MVSGLLRSSIAPRKDPHDWNSWDHYRTIHEIRISEHPFVIDYRDALNVKMSEDEGVLYLDCVVRCRNDVSLVAVKDFEMRYVGNTLQVRCHTYRYVGWLQGGHLLLKYHNLHKDKDEYHHRIYDPATGEEIMHEVLERYQFPVFSEVLDELEYLSGDL